MEAFGEFGERSLNRLNSLKSDPAHRRMVDEKRESESSE
ncbi:MAG: hypothetical protein JWR59_889 [Brevundimonas sp.]|nr:hypothetical protein [Brevundimonas sp.]